MPNYHVTETLDMRGTYCPGPLMELIRHVKQGQVGEVFAILSSDSGSAVDIPKWAAKAGHEFLETVPHGDYAEIVVRKTR